MLHMLLVRFYNVSGQLPPEFDTIIPNGVLLSESSDDVFMCKHTWCVYVNVRKPKTPKGFRHHANLLQKHISAGYK